MNGSPSDRTFWVHLCFLSLCLFAKLRLTLPPAPPQPKGFSAVFPPGRGTRRRGGGSGHRVGPHQPSSLVTHKPMDWLSGCQVPISGAVIHGPGKWPFDTKDGHLGPAQHQRDKQRVPPEKHARALTGVSPSQFRGNKPKCLWPT